MSLPCRMGVVIGPRRVVSGLMEIGRWRRVVCGAIVLHWLGLAGRCGIGGRAGLMVRQTSFRRGGKERTSGACTYWYDEGRGGEKRMAEKRVA